MFGWRARIGCISPNLGGLPGTLLEMEHLAPEYPPNVNEMPQAFLAASGFEVVSLTTGGGGAVEKRKEAAQEDAYRLAKRAFLNAPPADGMLIVGGGAPIYAVIEALETDIARPVVAANFAGLWSALSLANVRQPIRGYGRLLTTF